MPKKNRRRSVVRGPQLELSGALCLAFVNTAVAHNERQQTLRSYSDLVDWGEQVDTLGAAQAQRLRRKATEQPGEAAAVFAQALEMRACLARIFTPIALGEAAPAEEVERLSDTWAEVAPARRIVSAAAGYGWSWGGDDDAPDRMLWSVVHSAGELLTSGDDTRMIRQCRAESCRLLFVDRTHTRRRKWCDMQVCGNRAKGRRHLRREQASRPEKARNEVLNRLYGSDRSGPGELSSQDVPGGEDLLEPNPLERPDG